MAKNGTPAAPQLFLRERVDRIAQGAALMTDTTVISKVVSAYANLITVPTLQATANEAMHDIPLPVPTEEELALLSEADLLAAGYDYEAAIALLQTEYRVHLNMAFRNCK